MGTTGKDTVSGHIWKTCRAW